jgi:uncharacterized membrane protein SirB2
MYVMAKHLHLTAVALSIFLFVLRFIWLQMDSQLLHKKWVKIVPHVIDTILLASAIWLCIIIAQYPFATAWVTFKLFGVIAYIFCGLLTLKWAKTRAMSYAGFAAALVCLALTAKVAVTKHLLFF